MIHLFQNQFGMSLRRNSFPWGGLAFFAFSAFMGLVAPGSTFAAAGNVYCWERISDKDKSNQDKAQANQNNRASPLMISLEKQWGPLLRDKPVVILDTNIFIKNPTAIDTYPDSNIVVPYVVISELESLRSRNGPDSKETAAQARAAIREIFKWVEANMLGNPSSASNLNLSRIELPNSSVLFLENGETILSLKRGDRSITSLDLSKADDQILALAIALKKIPELEGYIEVKTDDGPLLLKAISKHIKASKSATDARTVVAESTATDRYKPLKIEVPAEVYFDWRAQEGLSLAELGKFLPTEGLLPNQFVDIQPLGATSPDEVLVGMIKVPRRHDGKFDHTRKELVFLELPPDLPMFPRNAEQRKLLHALMDESIKIITVPGAAGSGKTQMAILAAMLQSGAIPSSKKPIYERMMLVRRLVESDETMGFLPGTVEEKTSPYTEPFMEAMTEIFKLNRAQSSWSQNQTPAAPAQTAKTGKKSKGNGAFEGHHRDSSAFPSAATAEQASIAQLVQTGKLRFAPLNFLRGTTIKDSIIILDEGQALTRENIKLIATRVGDGSKLVILADQTQIDPKGLTSFNNGVQLLTERFVGVEFYTQMSLIEPVRSEVAAKAVELLSH